MSRCKEASDFVLHVGPARLPAHKRVLAGRSPVFAAMFDHQDMAENRTNSLRLSDDDDVEVIDHPLPPSNSNSNGMALIKSQQNP